jgi:SAM-dependent methyltransferase
MNRRRFSTIAHRDHVFFCPMSSSRASELVTHIDLPAASRVVDIGCGKAEFLLRVVKQYAASGVGVEPNGEFLRIARTNAETRGLGARLEWHEAEAAVVTLKPGSFELALCFGASHAYGGFVQALAALGDLVRPGGQVLIADPYWRQTPAQGYLEFLGASASDHMSHSENETAGEALGLTPLYTATSSEEEWDHYESLYCRAVERFASDHPDDPDAAPFRERIREWREAYRKWGRDTLGFGFYLYRTP